VNKEETVWSSFTELFKYGVKLDLALYLLSLAVIIDTQCHALSVTQSPLGHLKMPNESAKRAWHHGYCGVTFQNGAKQTPSILNAVTFFQDGADL